MVYLQYPLSGELPGYRTREYSIKECLYSIYLADCTDHILSLRYIRADFAWHV